MLALADAAPAVSWGGDVRHLPFVDVAAEEIISELALTGIQQDPGADSFVISRRPAPWAERQSERWHEPRTRDLGGTLFVASEQDLPGR
jgi:hypothetical protein